MESDIEMNKLNRQDLMSLEQYSELRPEFREKVMQHKKHRRIEIGPNLNLYFEDRLTMQYQVQEMLRIEKIFEADAIEEELGAYNPLIPDGKNWKATAMLEYPDVEERKRKLAVLGGIEDLVWVKVDGHDPVYAISNEDLQRTTDEKTSAVHFMRFELEPSMIDALLEGKGLTMGANHDLYRHEVSVEGSSKQALISDLNPAAN